jgi:hypothetical protein
MRKVLQVLVVPLLIMSSQTYGRQEKVTVQPVTGSLSAISGAGCNAVVFVTDKENSK